MDILLPPWLGHARVRFRYLDNTGASRAPYNGAPKTGTFGGDRLSASIEFTPQGGASTQMERAALIAFLARLRGKQNRAYLFDAANRLRGSFPATELISNGTFANGTTGFTSSASTVSVNDRVGRGTFTEHLNAGDTPIRTGNVTVTQYAPYVGRIFVSASNSPALLQVALRNAAASLLTSDTAVSGPSLHSVSFVPYETVLRTDLRFSSGVTMAGQFVDVPYFSLSRCALVDNGPNSLLRSDEFDNAYWTASDATVTANTATAPDGTVTGDRLTEATTTAGHWVGSTTVTVSSSALDYSLSCALIAGTGRTWGMLVLQEQTGSTSCTAFFDLSTGAVGTVTAGANWSNARAVISPLGDGWYKCTVTGRKTNAATGLRAIVQIASADGVSSYLGVSGNHISMWRATLAQSSLPARLAQTTTVATSGVSQTGSALYIKGLPASTSGLLLPNDQCEVITSRGSELKIVTAALDSDAAGLGYLQFEPPLRGVPANDAPIILVNPMSRFMFIGDFPEWSTDPGIITTASAEFEEV